MHTADETSASTPERLELETLIPGTPEQVFPYFTEPDLLSRWWPQEATVEPKVGGAYELRWPAMKWTLRGQVTDIAPSKKLGFTWKWDHEPDLPQRTVVVTFAEDGGQTKLVVQQGPYADDDRDQEDRDSHIDGWIQFLARLAKTVGTSGSP